MGPGALWCPLGWRLFITPKRGTIFCDFYKSITPTKGAIFCDVYKSRNPTKGTIFCVVYKSIANNPPKMSNLTNWIEPNQCIDCDICNHKNWHHQHELTQTCGGSKYECPVWMRPAENFQTRLRTSLRINERWTNKYDSQNSINIKRRLEQISWRRF